MIWVFVAAAIFGGAFLIPMILGGLDSEVGDGLGGDLGEGVDVDVDMDVDVDVIDVGTDVDVGSDLDADGGAEFADTGGSDAIGAIFASLVSFRTVVFFSAFFGASGLAFGALGYSSVVTLATAVLIGVIAALANSALFGLIKNSQSDSQISDRTLVGRRARVVLPMDGVRRGRIRIDLTGQPLYLVARSIDEGPEQGFDVGASVVVVKIEDGTALVTSLAELDLGEET